ncbi:MAG: DUF177 domain-containing protein [Candidatus Omnitrophica bacterium]|nr:DUF177 domain-containing protein [Candidatus Omnitrophota bacterium]
MILHERLMRVKLNEIPESGLTVSERFDPEELKLQTPELKFTGPLEVTGFFQRERSTVFVKVSTAGDQEMVCDRCLETFVQPYGRQFDFGYSVKDELVLDITDDVRQEILLSYPVKFLCREGCEGLCPRCGKNLNVGPCSCPR